MNAFICFHYLDVYFQSLYLLLYPNSFSFHFLIFVQCFHLASFLHLVISPYHHVISVKLYSPVIMHSVIMIDLRLLRSVPHPFPLQDFAKLRHRSSVSSSCGRLDAHRRRLLSEMDASVGGDSSACSVDDVLQLLQLLFAISQDGAVEEEDGQMNVAFEEFFSKKITNKIIQQIQVSLLAPCQVSFPGSLPVSQPLGFFARMPWCWPAEPTQTGASS